jgi:hypothetical protein
MSVTDLKIAEDESRLSLHDECEANCQKRWDALSPEAKRLFFNNSHEGRAFMWLLWQKQFYQALAEAYEREFHK